MLASIQAPHRPVARRKPARTSSQALVGAGGEGAAGSAVPARRSTDVRVDGRKGTNSFINGLYHVVDGLSWGDRPVYKLDASTSSAAGSSKEAGRLADDHV